MSRDWYTISEIVVLMGLLTCVEEVSYGTGRRKVRETYRILGIPVWRRTQ